MCPLGQLRSKAVYVLQNPVSVFFNWALVGRERRDFGSNRVATHEWEVGVGGASGEGEDLNPSHLRQLLVIWVLFFEYRVHSHST